VADEDATVPAAKGILRW